MKIYLETSNLLTVGQKHRTLYMTIY